MNNYNSLKKQNKNPFFAVVALALCVALSSSMLFSRMIGYSAHNIQQYIPLTASSGQTQVTHVPQRLSQPQGRGPSTHGRIPVLAAPTQVNPGNAQESWIGTTDLELFCLSYENGEGQITVQSMGGDHVIAPGTSHAFTFSLENTGQIPLDYEIEVEAYFTVENGDEKIPVELRLFDHNGNYLFGSPDSFTALSERNTAKGTGSLSAGYIAPYTVEWQWPFEGDDAYDTFLGNHFLENETEASFVLEIRTYAELGDEGGIPDTGDEQIGLAALAFGASSIALLLLFIPHRKKREDEDAQA